MGTKLTNVQLEEMGFYPKQCADGVWWLYRHGEDLFLQVSDESRRVDLYDNGWVENRLTEEEFKSAYEQIKAKNESD